MRWTHPSFSYIRKSASDVPKLNFNQFQINGG
jgi:hypothetical protein